MEFTQIYSWDLIISFFLINNPSELKQPKKAPLSVTLMSALPSHELPLCQ